MYKNMFKPRKRKGVALVTVIIVVAVLVILGASLLDFSSADAKHSYWQLNGLRAHYAAMAGVDTVAKFISANETNYDSISNDRLKGSLEEASFTTTVKKLPSSNIVIESTGVAGNSNQKVTLEMNKPVVTGAIFNNAIYSEKSLNVQANIQLNGPIQSADTVIPPTGYDPALVRKDMPMDLYAIKFPSGLPYDPHMNIGNGYRNILQSGEYHKIDSKETGSLIFNSSDESKPLLIVVDKFDVQGMTSISGKGKVYIFVRDSIKIQTSKEQNPEQLVVFVADGGTFDIQQNGDFNGYIYGPGASVNMDSSNTRINGAILCDYYCPLNRQKIHYAGADASIDLSEALIINYKKLRYSY